MEFGLSEEQQLLKDTIGRFLEERVPLERLRKFAADSTGGKDADDSDVWAGLAELGIPALLIPEEHGGVGLGMLDAAIVAEELGKHVTPAPFIGSAVMAPVALLSAGGDHGELLSAIAAGTVRVGIAFNEAIAARSGAGMSESGGKLNGTALFAFDGRADVYLVADEKRHLHLVQADAKGLKRAPLITVDKSRSTVELTFADTPAQRISSTDTAFVAAIDAGRVALAADTLGAAQFMLDAAVAYAKEREQFNRPIGSFQAVKHMCAEMAAELEPCRALVWYAAHCISEVPEEARLNACHAKSLLADVGQFVAKTSTEVHGGMGFTDLVGLHYWFKRIGANKQWLGSPERVRREAAQVQGLATA